MPTTRPDRSRWTYTCNTSVDEMKADEYRYWQSRPGDEWLATVSELVRDASGEVAGSPDVN